MPRDELTQLRWSSWMGAVIGWGALAFAVDVAVLGPGRVLALVGPVVLIVAFTAMVTLMVDASSASVGAPAWRWWGQVSLSAASVVSCLALASVIAPLLAIVTLTAFVMSAPVLTCRIRGRRSERATEGERVGEASPRPDRVVGSGAAPADGRARLADLSTLELCQLWRATFWLVREDQVAAQTLRVVRLRSEVLDELELRHPLAVREWMHAGRHVADGPARYL